MMKATVSREEHRLPGREAEIATLGRAIDAAERAQGSVWLITGEAGVGKSRLVEESCAEAAARGFATLWGRCWEAGGAPPYWPWIQVLRALSRVRAAGLLELFRARAPFIEPWLPELRGALGGPSISEPPEPETARFRLFDAIASLLCDAGQQLPLCIVLEDLHAADASSLQLLSLLSDQSRTARVLTLATTRSLDGMPAQSAEILRRTARGARRLELGRFGPEAVRDVLARELGRDVSQAVVQAALRTSEGNALFLMELVRFLAVRGEAGLLDRQLGFVPDTLRTAIGERLGELSVDARSVL
ncbi:MAG TPA: AAA family ATPase, partial [Polyangiaceae bacterium]|nr:AAA family ATPase [Polyangiaceae bacterium]